MIPINQEFASFVRSLGMIAPETVREGGKVTRFNPDNGRIDASKAGWLVQFEDMRGGIVGSFADGSEHVWQAEGAQFTEEERRAFAIESRQRKEQAEREKVESQKAAAALAVNKYDKAVTVDGSINGYLLRKYLGHYCVKADNGQALILPIRDLVNGQIASLQFINLDGSKPFKKGGRLQGCGLILMSADTTQKHTVKDLAGHARVALCEGFATGASVRDALGCPVVVAFAANRLEDAARQVRQHNHDIEIVFCADNDTGKSVNTGANYAAEAAASVGGIVALASGVDGRTDFNDDFIFAGQLPNGGFDREAGLKAIREAIEQAICHSVTERGSALQPAYNAMPIALVKHGGLAQTADDVELSVARDPFVFSEGGKRLIKLLPDGERLPLIAHSVRDCAMRHTKFVKERVTKEGERVLVDVDCPIDACHMVLSRGQWDNVRVLNGVTGSSLIMTDGRVIASAGYDDVSGVYGLIGGCYPSVPDKVSRDDALIALNVLCDLLREFDFDTTEDASAAISMLISSLLRPVMRTCPMFLVNAATYGSGKTALAQVAAIIATGRKADATPWTSRPEELEKRLLSLAMSGLPIAFFDNLMSDLHDEGGSFAAFLTSENYSGRVLGESRMVGAKTKMLILATGNNVTPLADMARRTLAIRLTPNCENPEARTFSRDLESYVIEHREEIIEAILTLVKGYFDAGCPIPERLNKAGSFADWEKLARLPLLWLGVVDPWLVVGKSQAVDPDKLALGAMLEAITRRGWGHTPFTAGHVAAESLFVDIMPDEMKVRGEVNLRRWGKWFSSKVDVIVDGLKLVKAPIKTDGKNWFTIEKMT
ncbi:MAG: toprim domain-containing protein [Gammaproteobacteria bacterium]|nr:toprim domain-containing protein [Gammaproteobacteria bacterium]